MRKIVIMVLVLLTVSGCFSLCYGEKYSVDSQTETKMRQVDSIMAEIGEIPGMIDGDLCDHDMTSYKAHMTLLAQKIIDANNILKDVDLIYPIDLWAIYNRISANPVCGIGKQVQNIFHIADVSRYSNEERMQINENSDLCLCWSIVTGREEPTGFMKDGACRCTFGTRNLDPNIGRIAE